MNIVFCFGPILKLSGQAGPSWTIVSHTYWMGVDMERGNIQLLVLQEYHFATCLSWLFPLDLISWNVTLALSVLIHHYLLITLVLSLSTFHTWLVPFWLITYNLSILTCHSWLLNLKLSLLTIVNHDLLLVPCNSGLVTLVMSLFTWHSWLATFDLSFLTWQYWNVTLDLSILTCHSLIFILDFSLLTWLVTLDLYL